MRTPRGTIPTAILLALGLFTLYAANHNERLYVPLPTIDLSSAPRPHLSPFRVLSTEDYEVIIRFAIGDNPVELAMRRLNLLPKQTVANPSDWIPFAWKVRSGSAVIAQGTIADVLFHSESYSDDSLLLSPMWADLKLEQGRDYTLEIEFPPDDAFIASLQPSIRVVIDRGGWTDIYPTFPVLHTSAKVLFSLATFAALLTALGQIVRRARLLNTPPRAPVENR